MANIAFYLW